MGLTASAQFILGLATLALVGCSTLPDRHAWGERATLSPGWERVRTSAVNAARNPWVWAPLLGAGVVQFDNWDHRISDWARSETPIFGSTENAAQWSDDLRTAAHITFLGTVAFTPGGSSAPEWVLNKAKGLGVQLTAAAVATGTTRLLKDATDRERPNGADTESFPSGHTTSSAVFGRLASENLESIEMSEPVRLGLDIGLDAVTIGTAWARVEAGAHFPSDTLVGMALGNFCGMFFNDAFLGLGGSGASLAFVPLPGGGEVRWQVSFGER
jgi:membrane-associated phospholipid phosphatase